MEVTTNKYYQRMLKLMKALLFFSACTVILVFLSIVGIFTWAKLAGPPPIEVPESTVIYAADDTIIGETNQGQRRYWMDLEDISPSVIQATIAIEDQRFYRHLGFDLKRIGGALVADIKALSKVQGASTITQQYARNLFLSHEKTWKRKLKELIYSIRLEANYSKEQILEGYLNTIYYGHGTYGIEAASRYYFNKSSTDLSLSEAAMLAGIPKGPGSFSPFISWEKAKKRQELILKEMAEQGWISEQSAEFAANESLQLVGEANTFIRNQAPYFQDVVKAQLKSKLNIDELTISLGGLRVYTTLDSKMQEIAEETFNKTFPEQSFMQGALVAMDPKNGFVKALVGGRNYQESSYNRAVHALRQPGSTLKPILYYAALDKGFTPSTTFLSEMTTFTFDEGREEYQPKNYGHRYANGEVTMAKALALSDNIYAVKTHLLLGLDTLPEYTKKFGIHSEQNPVPSLALGTSGVTALEMTTAYSHFANGGKSVDPVFITKVTDRNGKVIYEHDFDSEQVLDPDQIFVMNHLLKGMFDERLSSYLNVTGQSMAGQLSRIYAGKSGSTDKDNWMIGFTPDLVTTIWTGYDKGKIITLPMERQYAKTLWIDFMEKSLANEPIKVFQPTEQVVGVYINPDNGLLATEDCPVQKYTYFIKGTEPVEYCIDHIPRGEVPEEPDSNPIEQPEKPWYRKLFDWLG